MTRDDRPGEGEIRDQADLIGVPWQILIGPKGLAEGKVELEAPAPGRWPASCCPARCRPRKADRNEAVRG